MQKTAARGTAVAGNTEMYKPATLMDLTTVWKDKLCASADTRLDRLVGLNQCTGDGGEQKINYRSDHPVV